MDSNLESNLQFLYEYFGVSTDASFNGSLKMLIYKALWKTGNQTLLRNYLLRNGDDLKFQMDVNTYHIRKAREKAQKRRT